jgi:CRISPR/Cas system-associated protein Cas10 (large subunit of type III CRISPR-Cas system)
MALEKYCTHCCEYVNYKLVQYEDHKGNALCADCAELFDNNGYLIEEKKSEKTGKFRLTNG